MEEAICTAQLPQKKPAGHFSARNFASKVSPLLFFPSTASNPAHVESELGEKKEESIIYVSATATTDTDAWKR